MRTPFLFTSILALACSFSCAELPTIPSEVCGNGVIDQGEDCDSAISGTVPKSACGKPRSDGALACRLHCRDLAPDDEQPAPVCPDGWQCGYDDICRKPTGSFVHKGPFAADVRQLAVADFDLDARSDVVTLGSSEVAVHYFEGDEVAHVNRIAMAGQTPAIGQLTKDGRADLVFAVGAGIGGLLGQEDRTIAPVLYTSEHLRLPAGRLVQGNFDGDPSGIDEPIYVVERGVYGPGFSRPLLELGDDWYYRTSDPIPVADLLGGIDGSECEEMVLSVISSSQQEPDHLLLVSLCMSFLGLSSIPLDCNIASPVRVAHVNEDGHLDLALACTPTSKGNDGTGVTYQLISLEGPFDGAPPQPCLHAEITNTVVDSLCPAPLVPLAVGDLDGNHGLDLVEPCAIRLYPESYQGCGGSSRPLMPVAINAAAPWTTALMGDINGDQREDVIAASSQSAGLSIHRGTGGPILDFIGIPTLRSVEEIALGDFDGDDFGDVALRERLGLGSSSVSVVFGRPDGTPEPPVEISRAEGMEQISVTDVLSTAIGVDAIDDLAVVLREPDTWNARVSVFTGTSSRLLQSTFGFAPEAPEPGAVRVPRRVTLGHFDPDSAPGELDVGALVLNATVQEGQEEAMTSMEIWRARIDPTRGSLKAGPNNPAMITSGAVEGIHLPSSLSYSAHIGAINVKGGVDRMVVAGSSPDDDLMLLLVSPCEDDDCPVEQVLEIKHTDVSGARIFPRVEQLGIADVDGDGLRDVMLLVRNQVKVEQGMSEPSYDIDARVLMLLNDGLGDLQESREAWIRPEEAKDTDITAFAWLDVDADAHLELLLLTRNGLRCADVVAELTGPTEICDKFAAQVVEGETRSGLGGTALAVGDVNGDGLRDVVVGNEGQFALLLAVPENP